MLKIGLVALGLFLLAMMSVSLLSVDSTPTYVAEQNGSFIYLVSSDICPHCLTLKSYLESKNSNVSIIETRNSRGAARILERYGIRWEFGVPLLFAVLDSQVIALNGFPTGAQNIDGYFMGHDYDIQLCESAGGAKTYDGGRYVFCTFPSGLMLGNKYSADYILRACEIWECEFLRELAG